MTLYHVEEEEEDMEHLKHLDDQVDSDEQLPRIICFQTLYFVFVLSCQPASRETCRRLLPLSSFPKMINSTACHRYADKYFQQKIL